ncbi:hypothetical protein BDI4_1200008 [Burkholderia diffusa]|nr:hypothetical protein BDI4_1200008 [Burkholderia diffusa]
MRRFERRLRLDIVVSIYLDGQSLERFRLRRVTSYEYCQFPLPGGEGRNEGDVLINTNQAYFAADFMTNIVAKQR